MDHENTISDDEKTVNGVLSFEFGIEGNAFPLENYMKKCRGKQLVRKRPTAGWADKLFGLVWNQKKAKCAWTFRHAYVNGHDSISFEGDCTECKAIFRGITNVDRTMISVIIKGYDENYNHVKRRQVTGERRKQIIGSLENESAFKVHRKLVDELIDDENEGLVPHLPTMHALRQIKYTSSIEDGNGALQNILKWKNTSVAFRDTILDVGCSPFFVKYQLPLQAEWYKSECQRNKKIAVSIDATGSIVKPPDDSEISSKTHKPKHIFLYNMMAKTESESIPICQMITQKQTARFICNWLEDTFEKMPPPFEIVSDASPAQLLAIVKAFTPHRSVSEYIGACISAVRDGCSLPKIYLRLDRSHFAQTVSRNITRKDPLKWYTGSEGGNQLPAGRSKRLLQNLCSTHVLEPDGENEAADGAKVENDSEIEDLAENDDSSHGDWLNEIIEKVRITNDAENCFHELVENAFYCEYDRKKFVHLLLNLPLWSNIMVTLFESEYLTATSQDVESNFKTLKHHVLDQKLVRPDKFISLHSNYLRTEMKLRIAQLVTARKQRDLPNSKVAKGNH